MQTLVYKLISLMSLQSLAHKPLTYLEDLIVHTIYPRMNVEDMPNFI